MCHTKKKGIVFITLIAKLTETGSCITKKEITLTQPRFMKSLRLVVNALIKWDTSFIKIEFTCKYEFFSTNWFTDALLNLDLVKFISCITVSTGEVHVGLHEVPFTPKSTFWRKGKDINILFCTQPRNPILVLFYKQQKSRFRNHFLLHDSLVCFEGKLWNPSSSGVELNMWPFYWF